MSLLRAASALADYDGTSPRWEAVGGKVAEALVTVNPVYLVPGSTPYCLCGFSSPLRWSRSSVTRIAPKSATLATSILKDYASDDPTSWPTCCWIRKRRPFAVLFAN